MSKNRKINPHCPVPGCRTKRPHLDSELTRDLHHLLSDSGLLASWVKMGIVELVQSIIDDVNHRRFFAYLTRLRQAEEMYNRALYLLFVADEAEIPHVISEELPNSFLAIWKAVNERVYGGEGTLDQARHGLRGEKFSALTTLNAGAHASFMAIATCIGLARSSVDQARIPEHVNHLKRLCDNLNYIEGMFNAGKSKEVVLIGIRKLHNASALAPTSTTTNPPE